jgi:hypothetical protein
MYFNKGNIDVSVKICSFTNNSALEVKKLVKIFIEQRMGLLSLSRSIDQPLEAALMHYSHESSNKANRNAAGKQ